jgi:hypothetical protein
MNKQAIAFRLAHNLSIEAIERSPAQVKLAADRRKAQAANRAAHAQLQRDIKSARGSRSKGK